MEEQGPAPATKNPKLLKTAKIMGESSFRKMGHTPTTKNLELPKSWERESLLERVGPTSAAKKPKLTKKTAKKME